MSSPSSTKTAWSPPADLRERMLAFSVRGTNLDPVAVAKRPSLAHPQGDTVEMRKEKARVDAKERRARVRNARQLKESRT